MLPLSPRSCKLHNYYTIKVTLSQLFSLFADHNLGILGAIKKCGGFHIEMIFLYIHYSYYINSFITKHILKNNQKKIIRELIIHRNLFIFNLSHINNLV